MQRLKRHAAARARAAYVAAGGEPGSLPDYNPADFILLFDDETGEPVAMPVGFR